jgi:hypothetical protein
MVPVPLSFRQRGALWNVIMIVVLSIMAIFTYPSEWSHFFIVVAGIGVFITLDKMSKNKSRKWRITIAAIFFLVAFSMSAYYVLK